MEAFDYSSLPLAANEIRILALLPALDSAVPVSLQVFNVALDEVPEYVTLSYVWGDAKARTDIQVDDRRLSITVTLETALKALRSATIAVLAWVDQICINQRDEQEKAAQVPLMGKIYSLSTETVGWLGDATPNSDMAMEYLREVGPMATATGMGLLDTPEILGYLLDEANMTSELGGLDGPTAVRGAAVRRLVQEARGLLSQQATEGIMELSRLPYFERGWVQQEVVIPKKLVFWWGTQSISGDFFAAGVNFHMIASVYHNNVALKAQLEGYRPDLGSAQDTPEIPALVTMGMTTTTQLTANVQRNMILRNWYHSDQLRSKLTLARLLSNNGALHFSHAKDRVYGILGLAQDVEEVGLKVDAAWTWEETFIHAAKRVIQQRVIHDSANEGLNFLSYVQFPKLGNTLPSWVPDLTALKGVMALANHTRTLDVAFDASRGTPHSIPYSEQEAAGLRVLLCRGVIVDRISQIGSLWEAHPTNEPFPAADAALSDMKTFVAASVTTVMADKSSRHPLRNNPLRLAEAEWRIPILGREAVGTNRMKNRRATAAFSGVGYEKLSYVAAWNREPLDDPNNLLANIPLTADEELELQQLPSGDRRYTAGIRRKLDRYAAYNASEEYKTYLVFLDAFQTRRSFLGEQGFVGTGPLGMQVGDVVCVFHGGPFPFVLREVGGPGGGYELVGEAFCDGVMDGEALEMGLPVQEFKLV